MKLSTPNSINPAFEDTLLVSFPQIGSSEQYDGGYRSDHISELLGIRVATVNRPIPKRVFIDLKDRDISQETEDYICLVRRTGEFALEQAQKELGFLPKIIYSGNSIGATAALIMANADPTQTTTGVIALDPVGQVAISHTEGLKRYKKQQFSIDAEKSAQQLEEESMGMPPFRTPATKLIPKMIHEFWGHWNIGNTPISKRLIQSILLGNKAIDTVVTLAERSPIASPDEQQQLLRNLTGTSNSYRSRTGAYVDISIAPGSFHSSMDKPLYFVRALNKIASHHN